MPRAPLTRLGRLLHDRELLRVPSLQTDEPRSASRLELFFDLAFVLVVTQLANLLRADLTTHGALVFAGLFTVVWWSWMSSTLYANRFDHDDVLYRLLKLAGMLGAIGMAGAAADVPRGHNEAFAICYVLTRVALVAQYGRAYLHVDLARNGVRLYLFGTAAGAVLWTGSLAVAGPARYAWWAAGVLVDLVGPLLVTASRSGVPLHLEHLPERFALFVILVLGESVAAIAQGLRDVHWTVAAVSVAAVCFVLTAALWWTYFDLAGAAGKQLLLEAGGEVAGTPHDTYLYGQLPLSLSLAAVGAGVRALVDQSAGTPTEAVRITLAGGVALYLVSTGVVNATLARRLSTGWWAALPAGGIAAGAAFLDVPAAAVAAVLALLLVAVVVVGIVQESRGKLEIEAL